MRFIRVNYILLLLSLCLVKTEKCYSEITNQQSDRIEGINSTNTVSPGNRWVYQFYNEASDENKSLLDSKSGEIVFQNPEWIIKASLSGKSTTSSKTDLLFYDAKNIKLVASIMLPNNVADVGLVSAGKFFYVLMCTPGKYNYDDAPLVLCLIDPRQKQIDRLPIIYSDFWLSLSNPLKTQVDGNIIHIFYDISCNGAMTDQPDQPDHYLASHPNSPYFKKINVMISPVSKGSLGNKGINEASQQVFKNAATNDLAAISVLAVNALSQRGGSEGQESTSDFLSFTKNDHPSLHLIRATSKGELIDTHLDSLKVDVIKIANRQLLQPGVFEDGTLRCVLDQKPIFVKNGNIIHSDVSRGGVFFSSQNAFILPIRKSSMGGYPLDEEWIRYGGEDLVSREFISLDSGGVIQKLNFTKIPIYAFDKEAFSKEYCLYPEKNEIFCISRFSDNGEKYIHRKYRINDGSELGRPFTHVTGNTGGGYCESGVSPDGWNLFGIVTEAYTSTRGYSLIAQSNDRSNEITIADKLPVMPSIMELRQSNNENLRVIYSFSGVVHFSEYSKEGNLINQSEWKYSSLEGKPLLLSEKNLVFIPKAGGYDAYRIFGEGKPEKAFEIYFRGSDDYVILLPNGFYAGSPGCERLITLQAGDGKVDASALAFWRNRPAEVIKALGGDPKTADILAKVTDRWLKKAKFDPSQPEPKASEIPKVEVNEMPPLWAQGSAVSFPIEVTAGASPLKEVTVRVNGISQQTINGSGLKIPARGKGTVQGSVTLAQGQNWIEVTTTDEKGRVSNQAHFRSILPEAPEKPKRYIVAMGCSEYDKPELNLQYAAKDAGDVLKTFQEAGGRDCKTLLLTNKDVGPKALEKIKAFVGESKESDEVILFCAGHGLLDEHLDYVYAGHQIDPEHPGDTGIHLDALLDAIQAGKSLKRLVLMDTCQSGSVGEKEEIKLASASTELPHGVRAVKSRALKVVGVSPMTGGDQQRFIEEMFLLPGQHRGINIIGASGGAEYAMESDKWNNGVFTSALIEALRDQKADMDHRGRISVSDLKTYLGQRVPELTGGAQKPSVVAFEQDQDFDLVGNMPPVPESVLNRKTTPRSETLSAQSTVPATTGADLGVPPSIDAGAVQSFGGSTLESVVRKYLHGIESKDESGVSVCLADQVDYYSMGLVMKSKAISDIRGDWKHFRDYRAQISDFQMTGPSSCQFVYEYSTMQGTRPRNGKLLMNMSFTADQPPKISSIKAKILGAK